MNCNKKMDYILKQSITNNLVNINFLKLKNFLLPKFKKVNDCIIISDKDINELKKDYRKAIEVCFDKTGYEATHNELLVNSIIQDNNIEMTQLVNIALVIIDTWKPQLKMIDSVSKICYIISCSNNNVIIRFHKVRKEGLWIYTDLEKYEAAVAYLID